MVERWAKRIFLNKAYNYKGKQSIPKLWDNVRVPGIKGYIDCLVWKQKNNSDKIVILVHPYHSEGKAYFLESGHPELYHHSGYQVVLFDLNGFGKSDDMGFDFYQDLLAVAQYFQKKYQPEKMIAHGLSFGAAVLLASLQYRHPFSKAIIENCLDEVPNYFLKRNKSLQKTLILLQRFSSQIRVRNKFYLFAKNIKYIDHILLIYSEDDDLTTPQMGLKIKDAAVVACDFVLLKGDHMLSIKADKEKYQNTIVNYLTG